MIQEQTQQQAKPLTMKELAGLYGVSTKTLRTWITPHKEIIGDKVSRYYTSLQVRMIFERLGEPPFFE